MDMSQERTSAEDSSVKTDYPERSSFGQYLRAIRIKNHISLEQVAESTRVRLVMLQAIENEDFSDLPEDVFTIGFLRAYAQAVGADSNEAVQRYQTQRRFRQQTLKVEQTPEPGRSDISRKLVFAVAMLALLIAASLFVYRQWEWRPSRNQAVVSSQALDEPKPPQAERLANQQPSEASKKLQIPASQRHLLTIWAHENSWVKVVVDQGATSEYKLKAGDQLRLEAQTGFNLLIGNVGGVKLSLDNQPVTIPGKRGEVVNINLP
jgi:cytoskeletal protein RodZ